MKTRNAWWLNAVLLCAMSVSTVACGDDDDDDAPSDSGGSGGKSGSGSGGSGGAKAGSGGKGGSGGAKAGSGGSKAGSGGTAAAVTCGGETCSVNATLKSINPAAMACCTDDDKCGQVNSAGTCLLANAPGEEDTSCPDVVVMLGGMSYPQKGCCTPKGQCGGKFDGVGWGCVPYETLQTDMGGPLEAKSCGGGSDQDAGSEPDAG